MLKSPSKTNLPIESSPRGTGSYRHRAAARAVEMRRCSLGKGVSPPHADPGTAIYRGRSEQPGDLYADEAAVVSNRLAIDPRFRGTHGLYRHVEGST